MSIYDDRRRVKDVKRVANVVIEVEIDPTTDPLNPLYMITAVSEGPEISVTSTDYDAASRVTGVWLGAIGLATAQLARLTALRWRGH